MTTFNEAVEKALLTWYPKDHDLHLDPHHPLGKLAGEWGELLDDFMKSLYKPDYQFKPQDELGDIWYYTRISAYQLDYEPVLIEFVRSRKVDTMISMSMLAVSIAFLLKKKFIIKIALNVSYSSLYQIGWYHSLTLDELTASNWEKLRPGSVRGEQWRKARVKVEYMSGGKRG